MSPVHALFWKEWRQQRWKLGFMCLVAGLFVSIGLWTRMTFDQAIVKMSLVGCAFLAPLFVAMGLFAEERESGQFSFQAALPVRPSWVYLVRFAVGSLVVAAPLLVSMGLALIVAGGREEPFTDVAWEYAWGLPYVWATMIWIAVLSMGLGSQAKAALLGLAVCGAWVAMFVVDNWLSLDMSPWRLSTLFTPFGFFYASYRVPGVNKVVLLHGLIVAIVFSLGLARFGRMAGRIS
jgi:hypothetical protein